MATHFEYSELVQLTHEFDKIDTDKDGEISYIEFIKGLSTTHKITNRELNQLFFDLDANNNGFINYSEFLAATITKSMYLKEDKLKECFSAFDLNGDGFITSEELKTAVAGI
jgi:calcium-dependent protein kinase